MKLQTQEARIEDWFMRAEASAAKSMLEKIMLILRVREVVPQEPRRGRPRKQKEAEVSHDA